VEILAAIGFVRNIIEFVDFSSNLISKTAQLYQSNKGALVEKIDVETATNHLVLLNNKLKDAATATAIGHFRTFVNHVAPLQRSCLRR
jgi:hypothetical protein